MTDIEELREKVLLAALAHVPFDGWTDTALRAGAADAGLEPSDARRAFPRGPIEAVEAYSAYADRKMLEALATMNLAAMRTRDRIAAAIRIRLQQAAPHREAVRRSLTVLALPFNAPVALRCIHRTVDAIWYAAGDTATDYNWYTKRGLLAGVLSATVLYWLNDKSEGSADTFVFLDRRLDEVLRVGGALGRAGGAFSRLIDPLGRFRRPMSPGR
jgi:ubiquinone biosynthesis protein COQ9